MAKTTHQDRQRTDFVQGQLFEETLLSGLAAKRIDEGAHDGTVTIVAPSMSGYWPEPHDRVIGAGYPESIGGTELRIDRSAEAVLKPGDSEQVRPSVPIQDSRQSGVVHGGEVADRSEATSIDGGDEVDDEQSGGFGNGVQAGEVRPVLAEGVGAWSSGSCHVGETDAIPHSVVDVESNVRPNSVTSIRYVVVSNQQQLGKGVAEVIENYHPRGRRHDWHLDRNFVIAAVVDTEPNVAYQSRDLIGNVAPLVHWCRTVAGLPQTREIVFAQATIEEYIATGCPQLSSGSKANRRTQLNKVSQALFGSDTWQHARQQPFRPSDAPAPYSAAEQVAFRSWAASQSTASKRLNAGILIGLGFGCGLSSEDINPLRVDDIANDNNGVHVLVRGRRARIVTCRADWEQYLLDAVEAIEPGAFLFRHKRRSYKKGSNYYSHFIERECTGDLWLNSQRARVTWLVHHMSHATALNTLLTAAGIKDTKALGRYLGFVAIPDTAEAARQLRSA